MSRGIIGHPEIRLFTEQIDLALDAAITEKEYRVGGEWLMILNDTGYAKIRMNEPDAPQFDTRYIRTVTVPFYRFFLTSDVQAGKVLSIITGMGNPPSGVGKVDITGGASIATETTLSNIYTDIQKKANKAAVPTIYNVTMTNADTEYSQALAVGTIKFTVASRDRSAFRLAFATGKVATPTAPWFDVLSGEVYNEDGLQLTSSPRTLYFASSVAGKIIEIIEWT